MANVTIADLPAASAVTAADVAPLVSGGNTTKATPAQMVTAALNAAPVTVAQGGTGATTAAAARTALGLGTMATLNSPVPVANGGTGATTQADAANNILPPQAGHSGHALLTSGSVVTFGILGLAGGGTNASTQAGAANNILPAQTGNSGKFLVTNGTNVSWSLANKFVTATKTAAYTVTANDEVIFADCSTAGFTITLPPAAGNAGLCVYIKRTDTSVNTLDVASSGGQIEGGSSATQGPGVSVQYVSDGTNWWELANG